MVKMTNGDVFILREGEGIKEAEARGFHVVEGEAKQEKEDSRKGRKEENA